MMMYQEIDVSTKYEANDKKNKDTKNHQCQGKN